MGLERNRLDTPLGIVEFERTKEEIVRYLPQPPATVADIGGGPGAYALWLAQLGYSVVHRDLVPHHVDEMRRSAAAVGVSIDAGVGDARDVDIPDGSVAAVLLLGPLYHMTRRLDRLRALQEARRILRSGGMVFAAAISRWVPRLHADVALRLYRELGDLTDELDVLERTGNMRRPIYPQAFAGFCHRPRQLRDEITAAGLECLDLMSLEGLAFALPDLEERLASPEDRVVVLNAARKLSRVPELMGLGPHLLAVGRRPEGPA